MRVYFEEFSVETSRRFEVVDITDRVEAIVARSGVSNGIALVFAPHATAAIIANEAEPGLLEDYLTWIREAFQPERGWRHNRIDNNAHAHLASAFIGASRCFPVRNGRLVRGTWQNIMLVEMDGPRVRRVVVEVMGE